MAEPPRPPRPLTIALGLMAAAVVALCFVGVHNVWTTRDGSGARRFGSADDYQYFAVAALLIVVALLLLGGRGWARAAFVVPGLATVINGFWLLADPYLNTGLLIGFCLGFVPVVWYVAVLVLLGARTSDPWFESGRVPRAARPDWVGTVAVIGFALCCLIGVVTALLGLALTVSSYPQADDPTASLAGLFGELCWCVTALAASVAVPAWRAFR
jgi:hypothetical protein